MSEKLSDLYTFHYFRTEDDQVTFQNKVVAEIGAGNKRSFAEFPFRCIYKRISLLDMMKEFQPLHKRGQGKSAWRNWTKY